MKTIGVEELVRWAYLEELPKVAPGPGGIGAPAAPGSAARAVESFAQLLTVIDDNWYGVIPNLADPGDPHPDALAVHAAVGDLADVVFATFDRDSLVADMADLSPAIHEPLARAIDRETIIDRDGAMVARERLDHMVRRIAITRAVPEWGGERPRLMPAIGPNGKAVWRQPMRRAVAWDGVTGEAIRWDVVDCNISVRSGRVPIDAYQVQDLRPDPVGMLQGRLRWAIWIAGLDTLAEALDGRLAEHRVQMTWRAGQPWLGEADRRRVLAMRGWRGAVDPGKPPRPVAAGRKRLHRDSGRSVIAETKNPQPA